jgi:hypothetical protein
MIHPFSDKNKFGYYTIGQYTTYSKLEAFEISSKTQQPISRYFNDEVYTAANPLNEPPLSLWEYYTQRAQQIRNSYDYVVVMYSGGADSKTVLDSFVKNNIHVDEIAQFTHAEGSGKNAFMDREVWKVAAPTTQAIVDNNPLTKHRLIDVSKHYYSQFDDANFKFDFIYQVNNFLHPLASIRCRLREYVDDWKHIIDSGKRLCLVWGGEKPLVFYSGIHKKHVFMFSDCIDNMVPPSVQQENNPGWFDELFYWTPDMPEIAIKQAHVVKNCFRDPTNSLGYLERTKAPSASAFEQIVNEDANRRSGSTVINGVRWFLKREALHQLIYPTWNPYTFSDGKPPSIITHPRDQWFWNDTSALNTARTNYMQGIVKFKQMVPVSALKDPTNFETGLKFINTKMYPVE